MIEDNFTFSQARPKGGSIHDYFGRKTIGDPLIASDLLRFYADPIVAEHIDLDHLQAEPTQFFGPTHFLAGPKEVKLDVPYIAHLRDAAWKSEVLIIFEHKSSPNLFVPLQLGVQAMLSLYKRWTDAGRPAGNQTFHVPITLMVLVYCGEQDIDAEIFFQDIFKHIPEALRQFVPQFRLIVINLRKFNYNNLPGKPETQAVVETMKRAFDATLAEHLPGVLSRLKAAQLDDRILELTGTIAWYSGCAADIEPEQIVNTVTNFIKGKKGIEMAETIRRGVFSEGKAEGIAEGIAEGLAEGEARGIARGTVLTFLRARFKSVPKDIEEAVRVMMDLTALESLAVHAETCESLDEFSEVLK
ncbi:MAG: Rpn family recombination-promoting nuclease/putative transposase [Planctomycetaceae bacterium]|nr:Rpn family recombination-promoting nuclease/putative transposase [Planctomycetaceae bacterium]